eukprot:14307473-Ditylum_brightwellii.AAC.1
MVFDEVERHAVWQLVQIIVEQFLNGGGGCVIWVEVLVEEEGCIVLHFVHWPSVVFSSVEGFCKQGNQILVGDYTQGGNRK